MKVKELKKIIDKIVADGGGDYEIRTHEKGSLWDCGILAGLVHPRDKEKGYKVFTLIVGGSISKERNKKNES